jgi:perosamine synthetase
MEKPALLGGPAVFPAGFPRPVSTGPREIEAALAVLRSGVLSDFVGAAGPHFLGGREVRRLESAWVEAFGVGYAVSVNSATSGLHAALVAAGVRPGDEVIVPPQTMSATATAVVMAGAVPVFVDALEETACLDPAAVEAALSPSTRAVIAVNLFGGPAPLTALRELCDGRGLTLIEDNAQGPGGRHGGRWLGTIGHLGVFSLNFHKTIQCGEGGVVVTDDERLAWRLRLVRNHGENVVDDAEEDADIVGYNYRLTEVQAAIATVQLQRLEELTAPRLQAARALDERLAAFPALRPARPAAGDRHVYYVYPLWLDPAAAGMPRDRFVAALAAEGCPVSAGYVRPLYHLPLFRRLASQGRSFVRGPGGRCANAERAHGETLLYTTLVGAPDAPALAERFAHAVAKVLHHAPLLVKAAA